LIGGPALPASGRRPRSFREGKALAACLAGSALVWLACGSVFTVAYGSNDDPARAMIVSGTGFASVPDEHLLFSNILLGRLLRTLYAAWPSRPWYDYALSALGALAHGVLAYAAVRAAPDRAALVLYAGYLAASLKLATTLQFTMTAFAAAQAGLLLALSLVERPASGRWRPVAVSLAVCLGVAGALVRADAFWLAAALTVAPAAVLCWRRDRTRVAPFAMAVAGVVVLVLCAEAYDRRDYARESAWDECRQLQAAIHELQDVRRVDETQHDVAEAMRLAGWSRNDLRVLLAWFYPDGTVFDTGSLRAFLGRLPPVPDRPARSADALRRVLRPALVPIALALLGAVLLWGHSLRYVGVLAAALAAALAVLVFLAVWRKLPSHVWIMVVLWPAATALALRPAGLPASRRSPRVAAAAALAAVALAWSASLRLQEAAETKQATARLRASLEEVPRPGGEALLVTWAPTFPLDAAPTFEPDWTPAGLRLFSLGWPHRTPAARDTLARMRMPVRFVVQADTPSFTLLRAAGASREATAGGEDEDGSGAGTVLESLPSHR
jgi:hypothetical protein